MRPRLPTITLLLTTAASACFDPAALPDHDPGELVASFTASETTRATLGVAEWEARREDTTTAIIGLDGAGTRVVELLLDIQDGVPDESLRLIAVFPVTGTVTLTRKGEVQGAASERLRALVEAVHADVQDVSAHQASAAGPRGSSDVATIDSALRLDGEGEIVMPWSFFGYRDERRVGGWCSQGALRSHATAVSDNGASCGVTRWHSEIDRDCRIMVHIGIGGFRSDVCRWQVYTE